ncbi:hypothetical protein E4631_10045 [Hymenobacter sp. UV11]|uniref:hypothetical protein n=1 Tax=Hymenobacter sp. UV11 TaxID=1849735 RepID=UPI00105F8E86|nr:hypothetical protein [Hymenobacter sp. UV11]TFZ66357.1 hypothetical protein E4631_10045 [Hymenobacter sp. UV11]
MAFKFLPVEKHVGVWRVKWVSLVIWVFAINTFMMLSIYLVGHKLPLIAQHPVKVIGQNVMLYTEANTGATSHVVTSVEMGDMVDLTAIQPSGWCCVTQLSSGFSGYVPQASLLIPDSTREVVPAGKSVR